MQCNGGDFSFCIVALSWVNSYIKKHQQQYTSVISQMGLTYLVELEKLFLIDLQLIIKHSQEFECSVVQVWIKVRLDLEVHVV